MTSTRILIVLSIFIISSTNAPAQVSFVKQIGRVALNGSNTDADSLLKRSYAMLINGHIKNHYSKKRLPLIYLAIRSVEDPSMPFELAYDNLNGNSLENKTYHRRGKYDAPGIRIKIYTKGLRKDEVLKLLEYGVDNLKELKKIRSEALRKEHYDQPETLSLSREKIMEIIN